MKMQDDAIHSDLDIIALPESAIGLNLTTTDICKMNEIRERKLYLYGEIKACVSEYEDTFISNISPVAALVRQIWNFNNLDRGIAPEKRKPITLFINSAGGDLVEGLPLASVIELSKTPVYTVNVGEWCSMAFFIGITGHKRFSLPHMTFLMHELFSATVGKISYMEEELDYNRKLSDRVIRQLILKHSKMKEAEYDLIAKKEFYMLPEEALHYGFIDEIISDIDTIL